MKLVHFLTFAACLLSTLASALEPGLQSYRDFDQTPAKGWRALADQKRFVEAARLIEAYLGVEARNGANLHFHAAQCLAFEGSASSITSALAHLRDSHVN